MDYQEIAKQARLKVLDMVYRAQSSHIGSNFSIIDVMSVLFEKANLKQDKILFSKGWMAATAYYFLAEKGFFPKENLERFCQPGEKEYIGLIEPTVPGIYAAGGSMGYGLPFGVGFALAKKMKKEQGVIYVVMSDGEMQIGTTWEAAMIAAHHELDNLVVIIDNNELQAMGRVDGILKIFPLTKKWNSFGWYVKERSGHNYEDIIYALQTPVIGRLPHVIIFNTTKGKGVSFMENNNLYHYLHVSDEDYKKALKELK